MNIKLQRWLALFAFISITTVYDKIAKGDPLSGQVLKFAQEPMIATPVGGAIYFGHDEFSTAYGVGTAANPPLNYDGRFMADDFADNFSSPVVHLTWWGSYMNPQTPTPPQPVQKFLIAWEADVPAPPGGFSQPGQVLQYEVVTAGPLAPGSGTFTETLERGPDPVLGEALFRYNAELKTPFPEQKDTVYWLKIVALVDVPQPVPFPPPPGVTQWGWHNRDYTIQNALASPVPNPGEFPDGAVAGQTIWHFQDDSVEGGLRFTPGAPTISQQVVQTNPQPQHYLFVNANGVGPIDGPQGIELHSKDLAFRLYTVPEPASCLLLLSSTVGTALWRRRRAG
jgi:hypothetical protein